MNGEPKVNELLQKLEPIAEGLRAFEKAIEPLAERLQDFIGTVAPIAVEVAQALSHLDDCEALSKAGWVPHYTTPFSFIHECGEDTKAIRAGLDYHYTHEWRDVRSEIENRLSDYEIDTEAKATFREALDAHEAGLYRCVCRVLFPEMDRLLLYEVLRVKIDRLDYKKMIRKLVEGNSDLTRDKSLVDFMPNGLHELILFEHLTKALSEVDGIGSNKFIYGLYRSVHKEEDLEQVKLDPVPNRHAAMHGLAVYSSPQNSLNMIFVADYIFQVLSCLNGIPYQEEAG